MNWLVTRRRLHEQEITWEESVKRLREMGFNCREYCRPGSDTELAQEDLSRTNLSGMDLKFSDLSGSNLLNASLSGTILYKANLEGADLTNADLQGADLEEANLSWANLSNADLRGATLEDANIENANLHGVRYDEETVWPMIGKVEVTWLPLDPNSVGAVKVD